MSLTALLWKWQCVLDMKSINEHKIIEIFHLGNILLYLFFPIIFKKLGSAFCQEQISDLHLFFPAWGRRFVSVTDQRVSRGFGSICSWCLFALFQSLVILLDILQLSHEISSGAQRRACSLPLQGLCSPREGKTLQQRAEWLCSASHVSSSSSWPPIPVSPVLTDCLKDAKQKTGWIFSLVHLKLFTALPWNWDECFQKELGSEKQWPRLYSWTMPQELIYCRAVWRGAAAPLEAEQFHTPGTALGQTAWATWPRERPLCPWQRFLRCLPTQAFLWFHNSEAGVCTEQKYGNRRSSGMQGWQKPWVALPCRMRGQWAPRALYWHHMNPG